jgi:hypothetical protein
MYFIFHPNKSFVQFQLIDYLGNSTDLIIIFTAELQISLKEMAKAEKAQNTTSDGVKVNEEKYIQKILPDYDPESLKAFKGTESNIKKSRKKGAKTQRKQNINGYGVKIGGKKYIQKQLTDYFQATSEKLEKSTSRDKLQSLSPPTREGVGFNIITLNSRDNESPIIIDKEEFAAIDEDYEGTYYLQGYYGRHLPFTDWLEEKREITSRYAPGLLHEKYLADFNVIRQLEEFGAKKSSGFTIKIIFLVLYYIYFAISTSLDRFSYINSEQFSILINNLAKPKPDTIRKFLKQTITMELAVKFRNAIYLRINHLDRRIGFAAYLDEHFVQYQGTNRMAKTKAGGKNKVEKGFYRYYLTCGLFSIPLFNLAKDGSKRLEKVIFEVLKAYQEVSQKRITLIIFDRGIKSFKTLKKLHEAGYHFICWSFPYKTIEQALKRRGRLKLQNIASMLKELIKSREESRTNSSLTGKAAQITTFFREVLPIPELKAQLRAIEKKEEGLEKWNRRDFTGLHDLQIHFEEYGEIRAIILEKKSGERIAVFTDIPAELAHPLEILIVLKKKQQIENFFAYKKAIQGDYIPFWELQEAALQKTKFNYELKKPSPEQVKAFEKRIKRIKNALEKIKIETRKWKKLFKSGAISKKRLKNLETELNRTSKLKQAELKEIRAFLSWGKHNKQPHYFDPFEPVMDLNPRIETFLNAINDLFFVNSRRIASDWGNALKIAKLSGEFTLSEKKIEEITNYTPEKLNDILLKGGGKALINPNNNREIITEFHTELLYRDEILIAPYLRMLNQSFTNHKYCFDTKFSMKFSNYLLNVPNPVKIV